MRFYKSVDMLKDVAIAIDSLSFQQKNCRLHIYWFFGAAYYRILRNKLQVGDGFRHVADNLMEPADNVADGEIFGYLQQGNPRIKSRRRDRVLRIRFGDKEPSLRLCRVDFC